MVVVLSSTNTKIHGYTHARLRAVNMQAKIQQVLITLTKICGLNCNTDSVHQYLQLSFLLAPFLTETRIYPSGDITHF